MKTYLIVFPLSFLAGLIDAIGGGGGLISLPAFIFAGLPAHLAVGTNKLSASCGTSVVTLRMLKNKLVNLKLAVPTIVMAILGSSIGARLSLIIPEEIFLKAMIFVLPICGFFVLNKSMFQDKTNNDSDNITLKTYIIACLSALVIGIYDGLYGPGTGTFLIIAFTVFAKIKVMTANANAKVINLTTNVTSLVIFLLNGQVLIPLGLMAAVANMAGGYIGAGLAIKNGAKIVRPCIILVLCILLIKIIFG